MTKRRKTKKDTRSVCDKVHDIDLKNNYIVSGDQKKVMVIDLGIEDLGTVTVCRYCNGNNVKTQSVQTRSADEGATLFCVCKDCKKSWKESQ